MLMGWRNEAKAKRLLDDVEFPSTTYGSNDNRAFAILLWHKMSHRRTLSPTGDPKWLRPNELVKNIETIATELRLPEKQDQLRCDADVLTQDASKHVTTLNMSRNSLRSGIDDSMPLCKPSFV